MDLSGAKWFKSSHSGGGNDCVEVAYLAGELVGVRDSKSPGSGALIFTTSDWELFVTRVKADKISGL
ncbi:DUF397 domain-containing protein [Nocardia nova]|uniref:DUF397 domain-containing protein n=1 Tax=Nocardia nova TaxID=37330 RepID=UPI0037A68B6A